MVKPRSSRAAFFQHADEPARAAAAAPPQQTSLPPQSSADGLGTVARGFESMRERNPLVELERTPAEVTLRIRSHRAGGATWFRVSREDDRVLLMQTPYGAPRRYHWSGELGAWVSLDDGHDMLGILMRDMLPHTQGLPDFGAKPPSY